MTFPSGPRVTRNPTRESVKSRESPMQSRSWQERLFVVPQKKWYSPRGSVAMESSSLWARARPERAEGRARSRKCRSARTHADYGGKTSTKGSLAFKRTRSFDFCSHPLRTNRWVSYFTLFHDFRGNTEEVAAALPFSHRSIQLKKWQLLFLGGKLLLQMKNLTPKHIFRLKLETKTLVLFFSGYVCWYLIRVWSKVAVS